MAFSMAFRTPTPLNSIDLQCGHFVENILKPRCCLKPQYCWGPRQAAPDFRPLAGAELCACERLPL